MDFKDYIVISNRGRQETIEFDSFVSFFLPYGDFKIWSRLIKVSFHFFEMRYLLAGLPYGRAV